MPKDILEQVYNTYEQQRVAIAQQIEFSVAMSDFYEDSICHLSSLEDLPTVCRQYLKFHDMAARLREELTNLCKEQNDVKFVCDANK